MTAKPCKTHEVPPFTAPYCIMCGEDVSKLAIATTHPFGWLFDQPEAGK